MPVDIKIISPDDFIRTTVDGELDLKSSRELIMELAGLIRPPDDCHVLIDTRKANAKLCPSDLFYIGDAVASYPTLARSKTAILSSMGEADNAKFVELVAQNRGARLKAFTSFEDAINWLILR